MKGYTKKTVTTNGSPLTVGEVQKILSDARAITALAKKLKKNRVTVSAVLRGKMTSAKILKACYTRAYKILAEKSNGAAA